MTFDFNLFFREAAGRICSTLDILAAMQLTLSYLQKTIPVDLISIHVYEDRLKAMRTIAVTDSEGGKEVDVIAPPTEKAQESYRQKNFPGQAISRHILESVQLRIVNRPETDPLIGSIAPFFNSHDFSAIVMRLAPQDKQLGLIVFRAEKRDAFTQKHAELISSLHEPLAIALSNHLHHQEVLNLKEMLIKDNYQLRRELLNHYGDQIIGYEFGLKSVMDMVNQVTFLDSPVLLQGETGVGKDVIANTIHYSSHRREGPFIKVNCGAIPDTLIDSELFGHEKGAFTGAIIQKQGFFERANGGTIFLDEIGELPPPAQVRLLRVCQYQEFERVGGSRPIKVDTRIIAATHRNLEEMVKIEKFRKDLFFRLNVFPITIPPLRDRKEDIPAFVHHFLVKKSKELKIPSPTLAYGDIDRLIAYSWPGNIRELENLIERLLILNKNGTADLNQLLPSTEKSEPAPVKKDDEFLSYDAVISQHIKRVLDQTKGKISGPGGAAEILQINPSTLRNKMNRLGIPYRKNQLKGQA